MTATKKKKRGGMKTLVPAALALCFTYFIFAPAEQYMLNQSEMWFSLWGIVPQALLTFAVAMVVLCLIGYLLPVKMRRAMSAVLISLALCFELFCGSLQNILNVISSVVTVAENECREEKRRLDL